MTIYRLWASIAAAAFLSVAACSSPAQDDEVAAFIQEASVANLFEIRTSELALQRAQNPQVRAFALSMITDHTKAGYDLDAAASAAKSKGLPAGVLDDAHLKMYEELADASAEAFDDKYIDLQTRAHDKTVDLFRDYTEGAATGPVKRFAKAHLAMLEAHRANLESVDAVTHSGQTDAMPLRTTD